MKFSFQCTYFQLFFHIFEVFSIFLFYIFHVTFPFFSISPGICSFPVFFNAFQNAFKIFSILFLDNFIFLFLDIVKISLWHMFLPCSFQCLPVRYLHWGAACKESFVRLFFFKHVKLFVKLILIKILIKVLLL